MLDDGRWMNDDESLATLLETKGVSKMIPVFLLAANHNTYHLLTYQYFNLAANQNKLQA